MQKPSNAEMLQQFCSSQSSSLNPYFFLHWSIKKQARMQAVAVMVGEDKFQPSEKHQCCAAGTVGIPFFGWWFGFIFGYIYILFWGSAKIRKDRNPKLGIISLSAQWLVGKNLVRVRRRLDVDLSL